MKLNPDVLNMAVSFTMNDEKIKEQLVKLNEVKSYTICQIKTDYVDAIPKKSLHLIEVWFKYRKSKKNKFFEKRYGVRVIYNSEKNVFKVVDKAEYFDN